MSCVQKVVVDVAGFVYVNQEKIGWRSLVSWQVTPNRIPQIPHSESIHYTYLNCPSSDLILPSLAFPANPSPSWAFPLRRSPVLRACFPIQMHSPPLHLKNANDPLSLFVPDSFPIPSIPCYAVKSMLSKQQTQPRIKKLQQCFHRAQYGLSTVFPPQSGIFSPSLRLRSTSKRPQYGSQ